MEDVSLIKTLGYTVPELAEFIKFGKINNFHPQKPGFNNYLAQITGRYVEIEKGEEGSYLYEGE